jgi:hypothetical protein
MATFPDLGKTISFKYYPNKIENECRLFVLTHSDEEPNKHRIFFTTLVGQDEQWQQNWKRFDIESEVIDYCYGSTSGFLYVARKGQHIEKFKLDKDLKD